MIGFLHSFIPKSIMFQVAGLEVHWYGFLMVVGGLLGLLLVTYLAKKNGLGKAIIEELVFFFAIGAIIGARIYYIIYAWSYYQDNFFEVFKIWQGGMAVHGVIIGGFLGVLLFCKIKKINFWQIADLSVVGLVAGQVIGRWGNYFNQELFGKPTNLAWGIPIELVNRPAQYSQSQFFHPTFLYESVANLFILAILLILHKRKIKQGSALNGSFFLIYLMLYSVVRFCLEFLRVDFSPLIFGVRWAMIVSVIIILISAAVLIVSRSSRLNVKDSASSAK